MGLNSFNEVNHRHCSHFIEDVSQKPDFPFDGVTFRESYSNRFGKNYFNMNIIGETLDDAIGETFDKCGKMIGLKYPAGPEIDKRSQNGNPDKFKFVKPSVEGLNFVSAD